MTKTTLRYSQNLVLIKVKLRCMNALWKCFARELRMPITLEELCSSIAWLGVQGRGSVLA